MKVITIANHKGGVGKTTTAYATACALAKIKGAKVLCLDLDGQGNLTDTCGLAGQTPTVFDMLADTSKESITNCVYHTDLGFDMIPGDYRMYSLDSAMQEDGKEYRLKDALAVLKDYYDYCVIDTPPALAMATMSALAAADALIIVTQVGRYGYTSLMYLADTVSFVTKKVNPGMSVLGVLFTRFNSRALLSQSVLSQAATFSKEHFTSVFKTKIRENIKINEAETLGKNLYDYAPKSNAAVDYAAFVDELLVSLNS